ncbi:hypothetical protein KR059_003630 [Drosophila kikkawai]|nr:hypothetical protein KR059_003630 [Drosophila kikkawai]
MRLEVLGRSVVAMSCGSLVTYLAIRLLEGEQAAVQDGEQARSLVGSGAWLHHWDRQKPTPQQLASPLNNESSALRHIILVRHGEYSRTLYGSHLTDLGRLQAQRTGQRLREMGVTWDQVVTSTMPRAEETATIILKELDIDTQKMKHCSLLPEGTPYPADPPPKGSWRRVKLSYQRDGPRIEAAFQRYFFRATPEQEHDSYLLVVGHSNVIRYLILRALQLPPVAWTRLNLNHGSITWLTVHPTGYVTLRCLGDTGFMPVTQVTHRRPLSAAKSDSSN